MKARPARPDNRTRPPWWLAPAALLVALSLVAPPAQLWALLESAPVHSHSSAEYGDHHHHAEAARHDPQRAALAPLSGSARLLLRHGCVALRGAGVVPSRRAEGWPGCGG